MSIPPTLIGFMIMTGFVVGVILGNRRGVYRIKWRGDNAFLYRDRYTKSLTGTKKCVDWISCDDCFRGRED
jgi:hypothetical protein